MAKTKTLFIILIVLVVVAVILAAVSCLIKKPEEERVVITEEIQGFSGEIKEIKERVLLVEAKIPLANPEEEPIKKIVEVVVAENTKILKLEFPKEIPKGSTKPIFPKETEISFNDLAVGDRIDVKTSDNVSGKIKNNEEVIASTINIAE